MNIELGRGTWPNRRSLGFGCTSSRGSVSKGYRAALARMNTIVLICHSWALAWHHQPGQHELPVTFVNALQHVAFERPLPDPAATDPALFSPVERPALGQLHSEGP